MINLAGSGGQVVRDAVDAVQVRQTGSDVTTQTKKKVVRFQLTHLVYSSRKKLLESKNFSERVKGVECERKKDKKEKGSE